MTTPALPLDALVGYTVTRVGHVYTLTPATKGPVMPTDWEAAGAADARRERAAIHSTEAHKRATVREENGFVDASDYWHGYALEAERIEAERDSDDQFQSRTEWREVPR